MIFNNDFEKLKQADFYLNTIERSKESWPLLFQVLNTNNLNENVYFLASKMLKSKIKYDFG